MTFVRYCVLFLFPKLCANSFGFKPCIFRTHGCKRANVLYLLKNDYFALIRYLSNDFNPVTCNQQLVK